MLKQGRINKTVKYIFLTVNSERTQQKLDFLALMGHILYYRTFGLCQLSKTQCNINSQLAQQYPLNIFLTYKQAKLRVFLFKLYSNSTTAVRKLMDVWENFTVRMIFMFYAIICSYICTYFTPFSIQLTAVAISFYISRCIAV